MKKWTFALIAAGFVSLAVTTTSSAQFESLRKLTKGSAPAKQIAYFKLKGPLAETPVNMPPLFGSDPPLSLKSLLERFKEARLDSDIVAVVIDLQQAQMGLAQLQEVHAAMRKFAAVDKDVYVHVDSLRTGSYALATGASHISVVPTGDLWLVGLYGESLYLRGTLDKIGCVPDFEQCGDFKSAGETFMRTGPSKEAEQMLNWLFDGLFDNVVSLIADSRELSSEKVREIIDNGPYSAEEALKLGLIDSVKHRQDFIADLKERYGESVQVVTDYGEKDEFDMPSDNFFAMFEFLMQMFNPTPKEFTEPSIAIVYVEGPIQTGSQETSPFGSSSGAFSTTIRKALDAAAKDDSVKAVVMRVDSPGGSALASEIILDASKRVAAKKPLVISMGNVAGSGGYYVACAAETIFADRGTITASIGVIAGKLVTTEMWDNLGVSWHPHQRGKMAAMMSSASKFNDAERAKLRYYMESIYEIFKNHVTAARGDRLTKPIDELAGGRVFTGAQALELGLIDKIGGLQDAIKFASQRAGVSDFEIRVIPEPPNIFDLFIGDKGDDEFARATTGGKLALAQIPFIKTMLPTIAAVEPLRFRAIMQGLKRLELIHEEGVVTMMPFDLVIR